MMAVATRATGLTNIDTAATLRRFRCGVVGNRAQVGETRMKA
jgi:hypothetical protein